MGNEDKKQSYTDNKDHKKEDVDSQRHADEQVVKKNQPAPKSPDSHSQQDKPL